MQRLKKSPREYDDPDDRGLGCDGVTAAAIWVNPIGSGYVFPVPIALPSTILPPDRHLISEDEPEEIQEGQPPFIWLDL